jgi:hypothetical protein
VIREDRELLARLSTVNQHLGGLNQHMGEVLLRLIGRLDELGLDSGDLRTVSRALASVAGELTSLGTAMVARADELDRVVESRPLEITSSPPQGTNHTP